MKSSPFILLALLSAVLLNNAPTAESVTCNPQQLSSCVGAITSSAPPSATCCANLRQQTSCLCQYARNPRLRGYVTSPNAKKVAKACGVPIPNC